MAVVIGNSAIPSPVSNRERGEMRRTPGLLLGPYYPLARHPDAGANLWADGTPLPDGARRLRLHGRTVNLRGRPLAGALVEIWHADHEGRYRHPSAPGHESVAVQFAGYGCTRSDVQGRFAFHSVVPGAYVAGDVQRAPHIHLQITGRFDRLVTQLFLPEHPLNSQDRWYCAVAAPELLTPEVIGNDDRGSQVLACTIVLAQG